MMFSLQFNRGYKMVHNAVVAANDAREYNNDACFSNLSCRKKTSADCLQDDWSWSNAMIVLPSPRGSLILDNWGSEPCYRFSVVMWYDCLSCSTCHESCAEMGIMSYDLSPSLSLSTDPDSPMCFQVPTISPQLFLPQTCPLLQPSSLLTFTWEIDFDAIWIIFSEETKYQVWVNARALSNFNGSCVRICSKGSYHKNATQPFFIGRGENYSWDERRVWSSRKVVLVWWLPDLPGEKTGHVKISRSIIQFNI